MSGLSRFPILGTILSNNVTSDRYTLIANIIDNSLFPSGQYVFYTKNLSIWYKYTTTTQSWTQELLYIASAGQSNTKFDQNGYPITAYVDINGLVKINYYTNGNLNTTTVAVSGSLPTVIQSNTGDTYLFWVPQNSNGYLYYTQSSSNFNIIHPFVINTIPPGPISSLQIQNGLNNIFIFSFTIDYFGKKVYVAYTDGTNQVV